MSRASNLSVAEVFFPIAGPGSCGDHAEPDPAAGIAADIVAKPLGGPAGGHGGGAGGQDEGGGILADAAAVPGPNSGVAADEAEAEPELIDSGGKGGGPLKLAVGFSGRARGCRRRVFGCFCL